MSSQYEEEMDAISTVYALRAGKTLTLRDYEALQTFDRVSREDQERAIDAFHRGYQQGLTEGGEGDVASLTNKVSDLRLRLSTERGLRRLDQTSSFIRGAQICREMMALFVEQGGDSVTASSIRANWNPNWGADPGKPDEANYEAHRSGTGVITNAEVND